MSWVRAKLETNGEDGLAEISVLVEGKEWKVTNGEGKAVLKYGNSISLEMDLETFRELKEIFGSGVKINGKLLELLREFCKWAGKDLDEYVTQAVIERLKGDCEEIASHGIPKAEEFLKRIEEFYS